MNKEMKEVALLGAIESQILLPFMIDMDDTSKKLGRTRIGMSQWYQAMLRPEREVQLAKAFLRAIMHVPQDTLKLSPTIVLASVEINPDYWQLGGCKYMLNYLERMANRRGMRFMVQSVMNGHLQEHLIRRGYFSPESNETADFWLPI